MNYKVWAGLSANPDAVHILKNNKHMINYDELSSNTNEESLELLDFCKINWFILSSNPSNKALDLLKNNFIRVYKNQFALNTHPEAIHICLNLKIKVQESNLYKSFRPDQFANILSSKDFERFYEVYGATPRNESSYHVISYDERIMYIFGESYDKKENLSSEARCRRRFNFYNNIRLPNDRMVEIHKKYPDITNWEYLSKIADENSICLLKDNFYKINWESFSSNSNDCAVDILLKNIVNISWDYLASNKNPRVDQLIKDNLDRLSNLGWYNLARNNVKIIESIFKNEYK